MRCPVLAGSTTLLVTLNKNPQKLIITQSIGSPSLKTHPAPPPQIATSSQCLYSDPHMYFIRSSVGWTYGEQAGDTESYAPFHVDSENRLTLEKFSAPPRDLKIYFEMP